MQACSEASADLGAACAIGAPARGIDVGRSAMRVLLSCRDAGAALQIAPVAEALRDAGHDARLVVSASSAAGSLLDGAFHAAVEDGPFESLDGVPASVRGRVADLLAETRPDAVVVGLADPREIGLDGLLLVAAAGRVPTLLFQDFWGETRCVDGCEPDKYLVLDAHAATLTRARTRRPTAIVGSPKHAAYASLDRATLRRTMRDRLGIGPEERIVGYFGQDLHRLAGYRALLRETAEVVRHSPAERLVYRPHPREAAADVLHTRETLAASGKLVPEVDEPRVEPWLLASDVVVSCFSTCGYDALQLARLDRSPGPTVIYADHMADVNAVWRLSSGLDALPPVAAGAALASAGIGLAEVLRRALAPDVSHRLHAAALRALPDARGAPRRAARAIVEAVRATGGALARPATALFGSGP